MQPQWNLREGGCLFRTSRSVANYFGNDVADGMGALDWDCQNKIPTFFVVPALVTLSCLSVSSHGFREVRSERSRSKMHSCYKLPLFYFSFLLHLGTYPDFLVLRAPVGYIFYS